MLLQNASTIPSIPLPSYRGGPGEDQPVSIDLPEVLEELQPYEKLIIFFFFHTRGCRIAQPTENPNRAQGGYVLRTKKCKTVLSSSFSLYSKTTFFF